MHQLGELAGKMAEIELRQDDHERLGHSTSDLILAGGSPASAFRGNETSTASRR